MKWYISFLLFFSIVFNQYAQNDFFKKVNSFLEENVIKGLVKYEKLKKYPEVLNALVDQIANFKLDPTNKNIARSFYINAYNILTINLVVQKYPVNSPKDISGFWDKKKNQVAGESLTLNEIENNKLRKTKDPRIHFVLVCAAKGCPKLASFAYLPDKLELQLTLQTRKIINEEGFLKTDINNHVLEISKIFQWYEEDFKIGEENYQDYISHFKLFNVKGYTFKFYKYDWSLNEYK